MSIYIAWYRCPCDKLHCCAGTGPGSRCTCGRRIWDDMWKNAHGLRDADYAPIEEAS